MGLSERFSFVTCALLVVILCIVVVWSVPEQRAQSFAESLVTQAQPTHDQSSTPGVTAPLPEGAHALDPALELARQALSKFQREVDDYTATLIKRERIAGSLGQEMTMAIKVRTRRMEGDKLVRPLHVYLKVLDPWLARGREVVWIENRNEGKLIAHEGGLKNLIRVSLSPTDTLAMLGNKYPITEIGLAKLMEKLIEKGERDRRAGPCEVTITPGAEVANRQCLLIEVKHPDPDPRFDFHIAQIYLDEERRIPLRYVAYLWPDKPGAAPPLEEEYTYVDVKLNVGLTDADFDPENPAYEF